jgi:hypothetical protein
MLVGPSPETAAILMSLEFGEWNGSNRWKVSFSVMVGDARSNPLNSLADAVTLARLAAGSSMDDSQSVIHQSLSSKITIN